ncbi:flagellar basal body L-ring protein FlgH [Pseudooceanicola sp. C21-150M6]|uniref:flagellar basal body L-ring protein FlgH n=1 Tax=Pseudooceanicola sp. C21-150M6 TaxID=3434355 RepID=UPI003D7FC2AC
MKWMIPVFLFLLGCTTSDRLGEPPGFTPVADNQERLAMLSPTEEFQTSGVDAIPGASLWNFNRQSLLGDRRAMRRGDILTVLVEIDDKAEISNTSARSRSADQSLSLPQFFGIPQRIDARLPDGASLDNAVSIGSSSDANGAGSVRRNEKLTLRVAATITNILPNGVLEIQGSQEVRVNYELRELIVSGFVRPEDISRQNSITYDKIASARVSYGGRGQITDMQQPRLGQQVVDAILPF